MEIETNLFQRVLKVTLLKLGYVFIALGMFLADQTLTSVVMFPQLFNLKYTTTLTVILSSLTVAFCLLTLWLANKMNLTDFKLKMRIPKFIGVVVLSAVVISIVMAIGSIIITNGGEATSVNQQLLNNLLKTVPLIPYVLVTVLLAPVVEEFIFRGLIISKLSPKYKWAGVVVSVIIFALVHSPNNLGSWILYGGTGVVLAFTYCKMDSLGTNIAIHLVNNAKTVLIMVLLLS
ncbi:MAG: lysostaphin resistance A-like protein [Pseudolactococcus laudensis]